LRYFILFVRLFLFATLLSGCAIASSIIDSYKKVGVTESDRIGLLEEHVKEFHQGIYWNKPEYALKYTAPEGRQVVLNKIKAKKNSERIVSSEVSGVEFTNEAYDADVEVSVKFYKIPRYIVEERTEKERWHFSTPFGWKFISSKIYSPPDE